VNLARPLRHLVATLCVLSALSATACSEGPTGPSSGAPYSQVDLRLGTGTEAVTGRNVVVNYTGWLYDPSKPDGKGLQFDSSEGQTPLTFTVGSGQVIQGFDRGVTGMKVGGARRVVIPPSLGYGAARNNSIPPYATLVFEVELVEVVATAP
jgi:FKBP-type peptidyl-prolyl cis-trans isomerase FkpA